MIFLLSTLSLSGVLEWKSYFLLHCGFLQSILDSVSFSTYFHLFSNVHRFVGIHYSSPDFYTIGVYYKFVFLYCYPNGVFCSGTEQICSFCNLELISYLVLNQIENMRLKPLASFQCCNI